MHDETFEWDETKAAENYTAHGVRFEAARDVFKDAFAVDWLDERVPYGEDRYAILGMVENRLLFVAYTMRGERIRIISTEEPKPMKNADTTKKTPTKHDWSRFDALNEAQRHAAAQNDPDAQPVTSENERRMKRTPQVTVIRRALGLSQEGFATRFHIPLGTLRDWEQNRKEPDAAARAYLIVIARNPEAVSEALQPQSS